MPFYQLALSNSQPHTLCWLHIIHSVIPSWVRSLCPHYSLISHKYSLPFCHLIHSICSPQQSKSDLISMKHITNNDNVHVLLT